jgi:uncharacterized protein (TIGR02996 family)
MGMDTEAAFLAAMAADPDNNLPRLVFADWLEENGDAERAEFIRLQCEPQADDAAEARVAKLLKAKSKTWRKPFKLFGKEVLFHRGFPHHLKVEFPLLVEHQQLLALAPDWHLSPTRDEWDFEPQLDLCERFAAGPYLDRVRGLCLAWAGWQPEELTALLTPPLMARLRELRFGDCDGEAEFAALLALDDLRLEALGFVGDSYGIGDDGCRLIAEDSRFATLTTLELPNNGVSEDGIAALAHADELTGLRDLILTGGSNSSNDIGPEGAGLIAGSENFRQLVNLDLALTGIEDDGFVALVTSPNLPALEVLNVPGCGITNAGLVAFAESDAVPCLNTLNVCSMGDSRISVAGLRAVLESPRMERLTALRFSGARFRDEGADLLASSPACRHLTELFLTGCGISVDGFTRLLESPHLVGVRRFNLDHTGLSKGKIGELRARFGERVKKPPSFLDG